MASTMTFETKDQKNQPPPKKSASPPVQSIKEAREDAFNGIFQIGSFGCIITGQFADAGAISMHGPGIAHEAAELAENNEYVAKAADFLCQVGPFAAIIAAAMPLALQLLVNHNILPAEKLAGANVVKPEVLESQVKTQMAEQAIAALKAQRQAEERLAAMQADYAEYVNGQSESATASA